MAGLAVPQEVLAHADDGTELRTLAHSLVRRPVLRVHVGPPVVLDDLEAGRVGDAHRARMRIAAAITRGLVPLRAASGPLPPDPTRPTPGTAASPGGIVPPDIP